MKYKMFPEGYDPLVALGPCSPDYAALGCHWTPEDTKRMRELAKHFVIIERSSDEELPIGRYCQYYREEQECVNPAKH